MQEFGWYHWNDLRGMVWALEKRPNPRKMRLAACAYLRRVWALIQDSRLQCAIETAEDFANFQVNRQRLKAVRSSLRVISEEARQRVLYDKNAVPDWASADPDYAEWHVFQSADDTQAVRDMRLVDLVLQPVALDAYGLWGVSLSVMGRIRDSRLFDQTTEQAAHCDLLRDIFGNPFRPARFSPDWRTDTAVSLARTMYESREFSAMPILADALQDAGCDNDDILSHCRAGNQVHVRGCWVVDLVLGKE
jgi:hypothetical protein